MLECWEIGRRENLVVKKRRVPQVDATLEICQAEITDLTEERRVD